MYAPFGTGVLVGPRRVLADGDPFPAGLAVGGAADPGSLDEAVRALPPEREETSSPNVIGAIALHAAMDMLGHIGWPAITDGAGTTSPFGINGLSWGLAVATPQRRFGGGEVGACRQCP